jgi:hypothetical protein
MTEQRKLFKSLRPRGPRLKREEQMQSAAEILNQSPALKALSPASAHLLEAAERITNDPDAADLAFMARQLVQCTLPHSDPGNMPVWTRTNGDLILTLQQGYKAGKPIGYPYGSLPRLLLFWITTEVVRTKKRKLELGRSLASFMREIGLNPDTGGGKRGDGPRVKEQMRRLFRCRISFDQEVDVQGRHGERWRDMDVAPEGELWWDPKIPQQDDLWESWIELGEKFFAALLASPVPLDMRALRALKRSPLALDLYAWASYRAFTVTRKGETQFIPWAALTHQLGGNYDDRRNFQKKARAALRKVRSVYPGLVLTYAPGGIIIHPSRLAIVPTRS